MKGIKSYGNSYLYNRIPDYEKNVLEFIMKSERIDKSSEAFVPIIEDVKRRQTSAVLSRVLMRDDVVLCVYGKPMPSSFKVFACKDLRTDRSVKVFIDCSGLISMKNGFYVCPKIDIVCTYLLDAMTAIVYNTNYVRIVTNANIIQSATECFVALSSHIFDYLRPNGYSENRNKIAYILAMYFQVGILGLDRSAGSVRNLAAKISGIATRDINAMEIYYRDEDLVTIDNIITCITETFKMKGVDTALFIEKWIWLYGQGTQFATELFTAFSNLITDAYCGSYINNQKTIEKFCGREMVNYTNAILRLGAECIDGGYRYESAIDREDHDLNETVAQDTIGSRKAFESVTFTKKDFEDPEIIKSKIITLGENAPSKTELNKKLKDVYKGSVNIANEYASTIASEEYNDVVSETVEAMRKYLDSSTKAVIESEANKSTINLSKIIAEAKTEEKKYDIYEAIREDFKKTLDILNKDVSLDEESSFQ